MAATIASLRSLLRSYLLGIVLTHLKASEQRTTKTSAFIEVLTLSDDQLIKGLTATYSINSYVNSKCVLTLSHIFFILALFLLNKQ